MSTPKPKHYARDSSQQTINIEPHTTLSLNVDDEVPIPPEIVRYLVFVPIIGKFDDLGSLVRDMIGAIERRGAIHTNKIDQKFVGGVWFQYLSVRDTGNLNVSCIKGLNGFYVDVAKSIPPNMHES